MAERITRRQTKADAEDIAVIYTHLIGDQPKDMGQLTTLLSHPGTTPWGCIETGQVISMLTLHLLLNVTQNSRPYRLIENVLTLDAHQGHGPGRATIEAAIGHAIAHNADLIMLLNMKDAEAKGFYEKLGFSADQKHGMHMRFAAPRKIRG